MNFPTIARAVTWRQRRQQPVGCAAREVAACYNDLILTTQGETATIDKGLQAASTNVKGEERSYTQLAMDCTHARDEMYDRRRDAAEVLDSENMTEDLRAGFRDQFAAEVGPHLASPAGSARSHRDADASDDENSPTPSSALAKSHKTFIEKKRSESRTRQLWVHAVQQDIREAREKTSAADDEAERYLQDTAARGLERAKLDGERAVDAWRRELEAEAQRRRGVREKVRVARANTTHNKQKLEMKAKEQRAEREAHVSKEKGLEALAETKKREIELLNERERKLDAELAVMSSQRYFLVQQAAAFEAERTKSAAMAAEAAEVRRETAELAAGKEGRAAEAEAASAELKSALAAFEGATEAMAEANAAKLANDDAATEVLAPANARKANAIREKETLAGEVMALQRSIEEAQNGNKDAAVGSDARVLAKSNELTEAKAELDKARSDAEETKRTDAASAAALASELAEHRAFATNFESATKAEMNRLETLKADRIEVRTSQVEKRRSGIRALEDAQRADINNLQELCAYSLERKGFERIMKLGNKAESDMCADLRREKQPPLTEKVDVIDLVDSSDENDDMCAYLRREKQPPLPESVEVIDLVDSSDENDDGVSVGSSGEKSDGDDESLVSTLTHADTGKIGKA